MNDERPPRATSQWCVQNENDNPHRELTNCDRVTEVAPGRFHHELTVESKWAVGEFWRRAQRRGATLVGVRRRDVVTTYGPWEIE